MDPLTWILAVVAGALGGLVTGVVPGLHVNTVAAVAFAILPAVGEMAAVGLVTVGVVHAFVGMLPATYLGAPGEEHAVATLPAHRMLLEGHGPAAVRVSLDAGLTALVAATVLLLPYKWLVLEPGRLQATSDGAVLWVVGGVALLLIGQESMKGWRQAGWAVLVLAASGALGMLGERLPLTSHVPVAPSPFLPLLTGCFGAAGLVGSAAAATTLAAQEPAERIPSAIRARVRLGVVLGVGAAAWTAVASGLTSAVAAAVARAGTKDDDPRPVLATLSAVNTAHIVLTFGILWMTLRSRTGLAMATQRLIPVQPWDSGGPPVALVWVLLTCAAAGLLGHVATRALDRPFARVVPALPPRPLALVPLGGLVVLVGLLTGWVGLLLFAAAGLLGLIPPIVGIRRVHLTGSLLVPAFLRSL